MAWEYKCVDLPDPFPSKGDGKGAIELCLNELGKEGWELASVQMFDTTRKSIAILKRKPD
jgi:hypothetical protein